MTCFCENPERLSNSSRNTKKKQVSPLRELYNKSNQGSGPKSCQSLGGVDLGPSLALAVPSADRDGVKPGQRSTCPKPQHARRGAGQQLQAGETRGPMGRGGGRGKVFEAAEAARRCKEGTGTSVGTKRPAPWLCAPAHWGRAGQSTGGARLRPLANGGGDRQHRHRSVGLAGNTQAKERVKGTAENLGTGTTEAVPLPPQNPCLGSCSQGCKNKRREKRRMPRKKQATAIECDYHKWLI